jgi:hypothetical protein
VLVHQEVQEIQELVVQVVHQEKIQELVVQAVKWIKWKWYIRKFREILGRVKEVQVVHQEQMD